MCTVDEVAARGIPDIRLGSPGLPAVAAIHHVKTLAAIADGAIPRQHLAHQRIRRRPVDRGARIGIGDDQVVDRPRSQRRADGEVQRPIAPAENSWRDDAGGAGNDRTGGEVAGAIGLDFEAEGAVISTAVTSLFLPLEVMLVRVPLFGAMNMMPNRSLEEYCSQAKFALPQPLNRLTELVLLDGGTGGGSGTGRHRHGRGGRGNHGGGAGVLPLTVTV